MENRKYENEIKKSNYNIASMNKSNQYQNQEVQ